MRARLGCRGCIVHWRGSRPHFEQQNRAKFIGERLSNRLDKRFNFVLMLRGRDQKRTLAKQQIAASGVVMLEAMHAEKRQRPVDVQASAIG